MAGRNFPSVVLLISSVYLLRFVDSAVTPSALEAFNDVITKGLVDVSDAPTGQGKAKLTMMLGETNVQASNFDWRSNQVDNIGDKRIAAVYIDLASAIFPDVVIDSDGSGGDDVAKPLSHDWGTTETNPISIDAYQWAWQPARDVAGYSPSAAFNPSDLMSVNNLFVDELSDSGMGCDGGYRGELMLFGDFDSGEVYEFSGDMDPNSLAGLKQGTVAHHAEWDVGGVSGAELINSVVSVLFGDGTMASGTIASDGSQAGSVAIVSDDLRPAPVLTVNGLGPGGSGTYTTRPSVVVSGPPGETVRVSIVEAFDPVDNQAPLAGGLITTEALVTARLEAQYPEFPVNNAKSWQHVLTLIPTSGSLDITSEFTIGDEGYALGVTAALIDGEGLPISTTTNPIHLLSETPAQKNLAPPCSSGMKLDGSGYCVADSCNADLTCPENSVRKEGRHCYDTFNDCKCISGYSKSGGQCVVSNPCPSGQKLDGSGYCVSDSCNANLQCPQNSVRKQGRRCYNRFNDCECIAGYSKSSGQCVSDTASCPSGEILDGSGYCVQSWCTANYQCPTNSKRLDGRQCYDTINDCECSAGYSKSGDDCVAGMVSAPACPSGQIQDGSGFCVASWCTADYQCPTNSERLIGRLCYDTINDCQCSAGFSKSGSECVSDASPCRSREKLDGSGFCVQEWCSANYSCPTNAIRKEGRQCYDTINDCECISGFFMASGKCIDASACAPGHHMDGSGYCVRDWCSADFQCPSGTTRIPGRQCYDTINDCS